MDPDRLDQKHIFIGVWHSRKVGCLQAMKGGMKRKRSIGTIFTRPVDSNGDPKSAVQSKAVC